jgi:prolyl-tRNA synthetase
MGTVAELLSDEKGLVWPKEIAPFRVHLVELSNGNIDVSNEAKEIYEEFGRHNIEVLWDDTERRAGEKFADSDLLGIPTRVVVSEKTLAAGKFEVVDRASAKTDHQSLSELVASLTA